MSRFIQIITAILVMLGMMTLASCSWQVSSSRHSENRITKSIKVRPFEIIKVASAATVHYEQGKDVSVRVEGDESDLKDFSISSDGRTLVIERRHNVFLGFVETGDVDVFVTSPDIVGVDFSGSGEFIADKHVDTDNLNISIYGSGDVNFQDVVCDHVKGTITGSGDMSIANVLCSGAAFTCVGSGNIKAGVHRADEVNILLQGSGDVDLELKDCVSLSSDIQGSGDVKLSGNVRNLRKNVMGSGDYDTDNLRVEK